MSGRNVFKNREVVQVPVENSNHAFLSVEDFKNWLSKLSPNARIATDHNHVVGRYIADSIGWNKAAEVTIGKNSIRAKSSNRKLEMVRPDWVVGFTRRVQKQGKKVSPKTCLSVLQ